jgi:hypothetical protein
MDSQQRLQLAAAYYKRTGNRNVPMKRCRSSSSSISPKLIRTATSSAYLKRWAAPLGAVRVLLSHRLVPHPGGSEGFGTVRKPLLAKH